MRLTEVVGVSVLTFVVVSVTVCPTAPCVPLHRVSRCTVCPAACIVIHELTSAHIHTHIHTDISNELKHFKTIRESDAPIIHGNEPLIGWILQTLSELEEAPWTLQRLAELIVQPRTHYQSMPKYLRALEKVGFTSRCDGLSSNSVYLIGHATIRICTWFCPASLIRCDAVILCDTSLIRCDAVILCETVIQC